MSEEVVRHIYSSVPSNGTVSIEVEKNSRGYNWKVRIERPIPTDTTQAAYIAGLGIVKDIRDIETHIKDQLMTSDKAGTEG